MASLIIFLCFSGVMFLAGYYWRKLEEGRVELRSGRPQPTDTRPRDAIWNGMVGKI